MAHYAQILVKRKQKALEQEKKDDVLREQREKDKLTRDLSLHEVAAPLLWCGCAVCCVPFCCVCCCVLFRCCAVIQSCL